MIDFLMISTRSTKRGTVEIYPKFIIKKSSDLMIRGGDFYAIWLESEGRWSTEEQDALELIDFELDNYANENRSKFDANVKALHMWDASSGMIDSWHKYCQRQMRDSYHMLDEKLIFLNDECNKKDYASRKLPYALEKTDITNYKSLMNVIYDKEEREKIEWAIGSVVTGDSKKIQKFMVLYGAAGTGKSTVLNIIQKLFDGYYSVFDAKALGSSNNSFALEAFKTNPLIAIQHDGDLSKIEDNTRLNSLVSHELMTVNEKFKATYSNRFKCFLFMGTNKPVKITDSKSGLLRRLIDVTPSGKKVSIQDYRKIMKNIDFELGGIALHCKDVYLKDPCKYDDYVPTAMMSASNDFYNFMLDCYFKFKAQDSVTLTQAWDMYKVYIDDAKLAYPMSKRVFKEELQTYFKSYEEIGDDSDGGYIKCLYSGFKTGKFRKNNPEKPVPVETKEGSIIFKEQPSILDKECANLQAQYASIEETPLFKWQNVRTRLSDIDTTKLHYVKLPENHIVIDFDIPNENGKKDFNANLREASKWPATYAELSKSGSGIHLHYIYKGDPQLLSRVYDDFIEIKVFTGNSSLRRRLTKCNDLDISPISSGLPLKGEKRKMVNFDAVKSEKALRALIKRNLNKEIHPNTKPSVDFIYKILEDAYKSKLNYDVTDMRNAILTFAANSTHQSEACVKLVSKMHFKSDEPSDNVDNANAKLVFYDVEVFPNLFLVNYKVEGKGKKVVRMINPTPNDIEQLIQMRLVGFNCRRYDNHILYGRLMGYSNAQLYKLSQDIVQGKSAFFNEAYNLSYTDVYDFSTKKQSLKKFEIELGIHHQELGLPWDKPVPEELWEKVAEYCDNDVIATEAVFNARQGDFVARQIQVDLVKQLHGITNVSVNDTTNSLSGKIIFGKNRNPQPKFNYRDLSKPVEWSQYRYYRELFGDEYEFRVFDENGMPQYRTYKEGEVLPEGWSILPFFPGYVFDSGKSFYLEEEIGEGGRVYSVPGIYYDVWDGDVASMHPHSIIFESLFGPEYTKRFADIVNARVAIKHKDLELAGTMLDGVLKPYLNPEQAPQLADALKIVINSIYGLTSAKFNSIFKDPRNVDNIVAKRGALFMTLLKKAVEEKGFKVVHIKTDSIKIPTKNEKEHERVVNFVTKFGKEFGYTFETEGDYIKFCLLNDAFYAAKELDKDWVVKGKMFQVPYVYKKIFSKEPIEFEDLCVTQECQTALYLDMIEDLQGKDHNYKFIGKVGLFTPMKPGCGAGMLMRIEKDGRYSAATGSKGYLWMESEMVKQLKKDKNIDFNYFNKLVDDAYEAMDALGDVEQFFAYKSGEIVSDPLPESFNV